MKSFYGVSATRIRLEDEKPDTPTTLIFGELDVNRPTDDWAIKLGLDKEEIKKFGHELYTEDEIVKKVCLALLERVTKKRSLAKKVV